MTELSQTQQTEDSKGRIARLLRELSLGLVERDKVLRLVLLAAFAGEGLIVSGPSGTGKTELARRFRFAWKEIAYREVALHFDKGSAHTASGADATTLASAVLHSYSPPAISFSSESKTASVPGLVFDPSSRSDQAICSILTLTTEDGSLELPRWVADRFLFHYTVEPVSEDNFVELIRPEGQLRIQPDYQIKLDLELLGRIRKQANAVQVTNEVYGVMKELRAFCQGEHIEVSDRRWRRALPVLQIAAVMDGRKQVSVADCALLQFMMTDDPEAADEIRDWLAERKQNEEMPSAIPWKDQLIIWLQDFERAQDSPKLRQRISPDGSLLYVNSKGEFVPDTTELVAAYNEEGFQLYKNPLAELEGEEEHITLPQLKELITTPTRRMTWRELPVRLQVDWQDEEESTLQHFLDAVVSRKYSEKECREIMYSFTQSTFSHLDKPWTTDSIIDFLSYYRFYPSVPARRDETPRASLLQKLNEQYRTVAAFIGDKENWVFEEVRLKPAMEVAGLSPDLVNKRLAQFNVSLKELNRDIQAVRSQLREYDMANVPSLWKHGVSKADTVQRLKETMCDLEEVRERLIGLTKKYVGLLDTSGSCVTDTPQAKNDELLGNLMKDLGV